MTSTSPPTFISHFRHVNCPSFAAWCTKESPEWSSSFGLSVPDVCFSCIHLKNCSLILSLHRCVVWWETVHFHSHRQWSERGEWRRVLLMVRGKSLPKLCTRCLRFSWFSYMIFMTFLGFLWSLTFLRFSRFFKIFVKVLAKIYKILWLNFAYRYSILLTPV